MLHALPFFPTFNFHDVFFVVGGCVRGGGVPDFFLSLSDRKEGREGAGTTHFYQTFAEMCFVLCP